MIDELTLDPVLDEPIDWRAKGFPFDGRFDSIRAIQQARPSMFDGGFVTPIGTLLEGPLDRNIARMAEFCRDKGVEIAPHAKTALAPQLFAKQLSQGAWGITVATPWQARLCVEFGVPRILLANELVDGGAARWMVREQSRRNTVFLSYVDSVRQVEQVAAALAHSEVTRPLDVLLEIGWSGGRTGCRTRLAVSSTVKAIAASPYHRLVGVAGFEGLLGSTPSDEVLDDVRSFLRRLRNVAEQLAHDGAFETESVILTAGGSGFFDLVASELSGPLPGGRNATVVLRSGGYLSRDAAPYDAVSPFTRDPELSQRRGPLEPAIEVWTSVLSRPEPGLALLDAGKRDLPVDVAMPVPVHLRRDGALSDAPESWRVHSTNDQHAYLQIHDDDDLDAGDMVSLNVVHPCTFFDKWSWIPVVDSGYRVVDVVRTFF
jgi:D-serine deaminase-like pyridoxal phosphate-dependent protein